MNDLDALEAQSISILREAFSRRDKIALLWSGGKDSNVVLWLARKAFSGQVPFPVVLVDANCADPEIVAFRNCVAREWKLSLIAGDTAERLKALLDQHGLTGVITGIRADEQDPQDKGRAFSPWGGLLEQLKADSTPDTHLIIYPLLVWGELDVWQYIQREEIPVAGLYFANNGRRYRSLGCAPGAGAVASDAATVAEIIEELQATGISDGTRGQEADEGVAMTGGGIWASHNPVQDRETVKATNITWFHHKITAQERWAANRHRGGVLWLTGLSGSGKSTLAMELEYRLFRKGYQVFVLDGDNVRHGLNSDLGFAPEDRAENIRRVGEMAYLFAQAGMLVITAFISPYVADRAKARGIAGDLFHEVWVKANVAICEGRDPKGLYKKARAGEIGDFTGISAPYEDPTAPEVVVDTAQHSLDVCADLLMEYIERNFSL